MKTATIIAFLPLLAILSASGSAAAQESGLKPVISIAPPPPVFALPLACHPGVDCWVMNYLDMGPDGDGKNIDPFCGPRTFDGNKGTLFALRDRAMLADGVAALAARDGTVVRVRDTEPDHLMPTAAALKAVKDAQKECGNAILLDHGNGLQSVYCHLKQGSITVKQGDTVKEGDTIAQVGMSGYTAFPQLHFGIVWEGAVVDPFTGLNATDPCGGMKRSLWKDDLNLIYQPAALYAGGFAGEIPTMERIDAGEGAARTLRPDGSIFAFWVSTLGVQDGDKITLTITAPDGTPFSRRTEIQKGSPTRQLYYTGRRLEGGVMMEGTYTALATLVRPGRDGGEPQRWSLERSIVVQGE